MEVWRAGCSDKTYEDNYTTKDKNRPPAPEVMVYEDDDKTFRCVGIRFFAAAKGGGDNDFMVSIKPEDFKAVLSVMAQTDRTTLLNAVIEMLFKPGLVAPVMINRSGTVPLISPVTNQFSS